MPTTSKTIAAAALLVAGVLAGCNPPPPTTPARAEAEPPGRAATALVAEPAAPAPPAEPTCPAGTTWNGEQCEQPEVTSRPPPPEPEPEPEPVEAAPPPKTSTSQVQNGALKLPGPVVFQTGSGNLKPESDAVLELVKSYLNAKPEITLLRIEGHTDSAGSSAANQALSEARALSVALWLTAHGVACKRLVPVGFGETKPIAPNTTQEGRQQNRRMEFVNAALKGKPIGGLPTDGGGKVAGNPCSSTP